MGRMMTRMTMAMTKMKIRKKMSSYPLYMSQLLCDFLPISISISIGDITAPIRLPQ